MSLLRNIKLFQHQHAVLIEFVWVCFFPDSAEAILSLVFSPVTHPAQRYKVVWVQADVWIIHVVFCQVLDVMHLCRRLATVLTQIVVTHEYGLPDTSPYL